MIYVDVELLSTKVAILRDVVALVAAGLAGYVAWEGLDAWKKQMKGKTDYELARRYLRAALKVRDSMKLVRNPFIPIEEMQAAREEEGLDPKEVQDRSTSRLVYNRRWKKLVEAVTDLDVERVEAEVSWGAPAFAAQRPLSQCVNELFVSLKMFLDGYLQSPHKDDVIYDLGEESEFSQKISKAVTTLEDFLRPHLR